MSENTPATTPANERQFLHNQEIELLRLAGSEKEEDRDRVVTIRYESPTLKKEKSLTDMMTFSGRPNQVLEQFARFSPRVANAIAS